MRIHIECINRPNPHQTMRTTLTLEDDAFDTAQRFARARSLKLSQAVSELIRLGSAQRLPIRQRNGVWVFELPPDTPPVSAERVRELLDENP
jgi:hypothetical protein